MDENQKKYDSYILKKEGNNYVIGFKDSRGIEQNIKVTKDVYFTYEESRLKEKSQKNKFDRYIEHSEIYENNLEKRAKEKTINMEDDFIKKATFEELKRAIEMLPEIQKRRIKKYYFEDKNESQIAKEEGTTQQAINYTLAVAKNNLKKYLKNIQF